MGFLRGEKTGRLADAHGPSGEVFSGWNQAESIGRGEPGNPRHSRLRVAGRGVGRSEPWSDDRGSPLPVETGEESRYRSHEPRADREPGIG